MKNFRLLVFFILFAFPSFGFSQGVPVITSAVVSDTCKTAFVELSVKADNLPLSYVWSDGSNNPKLTTAKPGSYTVTITDNVGNEVVGGPYQVVSIPQSPGLHVVDLKGDCKNQANGYIHITTNNLNDIFHWSHDPNLLTNKADNLHKGIYSVTMTDSKGVCIVKNILFPVYDYTPNIINLEIGGVSKCAIDPTKTGFIALDLKYDYPPCSGCPNTEAPFISFKSSTGIQYIYSFGSDNEFPPSNYFNGTIHGLPFSGSLKLSVSDHGCLIDTLINIPLLDSLTYNLLTNLPNKETHLYSASVKPKGGQSPYTYLWSDGDTNGNRSDLLAGKSYSVTITDVYGCTVSSKTVFKKFAGDTKYSFSNEGNHILIRSEEEKDVPEKHSVIISDAFGKVYSIKEVIATENEWKLDTSDLSVGVYYLSVNDGEEISSFKFVKMR